MNLLQRITLYFFPVKKTAIEKIVEEIKEAAVDNEEFEKAAIEIAERIVGAKPKKKYYAKKKK
jgi:Cdc6-like AAA superfamily ATPase